MESAFLMGGAQEFAHCTTALQGFPCPPLSKVTFGSVKLPLLWVSEGCNNPSVVQTKEHGTDGLLEGSGSFCLV